MRARALRLSAAVGIVAVTAWLVACGDVLPVDEVPSGTADASGDGGIGSGADANGDEIDAGADASESRERVVFVTSSLFSGNLGGIVGADEKCQVAADASQLHGKTFQAWISTSESPVSGRLTHGDKPYRRVDKKAIANDWSDLTDGELAAPLNVDEDGTEIKAGGAVDFSTFVWTGTTAVGEGTATESCGNWTSDNGSTSTGVSSATSGAWTDETSAITCNSKLHLYCIEK